MPYLGKILIVLGAMLIVLGVLVYFWGRLPFLGKLPGDFVLKKDNVTIIFPLATMIVISVVLTIVLNLFGRGK
jgi:hypothetical protein